MEKIFNINCKLENKIKIETFASLTTDNLKIALLDTEFAQEICDKLNISF